MPCLFHLKTSMYREFQSSMSQSVPAPGGDTDSVWTPPAELKSSWFGVKPVVFLPTEFLPCQPVCLVCPSRTRTAGLVCNFLEHRITHVQGTVIWIPLSHSSPRPPPPSAPSFPTPSKQPQCWHQVWMLYAGSLFSSYVFPWSLSACPSFFQPDVKPYVTWCCIHLQWWCM